MNSFTFALAAALLVGPQDAGIRSAPTAQEIVIPKPAPDAPDDMQLVVYDVADVLELLREPGTDESQLDENLSPREREEMEAAQRALFIDDAKRWMVPPFDKHGSLVITTGGALVANLRAEQQKWMGVFVDCQRRSVQRTFVVETQFVRAEPKSFDAMQLSDQTVVIGRAPEQRAHFEEQLTGAGFEIASAPRVSSYARQAAEVALIAQTAYVREFVYILVAPGNEHILDPIVDVVEHGVRAKSRVVALPNDRLGLALDVTVLELKQPIETQEVTVSDYGAPVTIGLPKVSTYRLETRIELMRGETLLVSGRARMSDGTTTPSVFERVDTDGTRRELVVAVRIGEVVEQPVADGSKQDSLILF